MTDGMLRAVSSVALGEVGHVIVDTNKAWSLILEPQE